MRAPPQTAALPTAASSGDSWGKKNRISSSRAKDYGAKSLGPSEQLGAALRHRGFSLLFQQNQLGRLAVLLSRPAPARRESSGNLCLFDPGSSSSGERRLQLCPLCKTLSKEGLEQLPG